MDHKGPVKVVVRKAGLVPGAKTVDLNSLRKIIAKTQNKQASTYKPTKVLATVDCSGNQLANTEKIRIKPDPETKDADSTASVPDAIQENITGKLSPEKVFIKMEPADRTQSNSTEHGMVDTDGLEDGEGILPSKRLKVTEQEENITKTDYSCCFCQFSTKSARDYRSHIAGHLKNKVLNCNSCPFSTDKINAYNDHVRVAHSQKHTSKQQQTSKLQQSTPKQQQQQDFPKLFACSGCAFKAPKVESLRRHQTVTGHDNFRAIQKCKLCSYSHKNVDTMMHHIMSHKPEKEFDGECNYCNDPGMTKLSEGNPHSDQCPEVKFPMIYEHDEVLEKIKVPKTFTCTLCDFGSEELLFLVEHIKAHAKWCVEGCVNDEADSPFSCTMCDYRCNTPNKLATHMRVHGSSTLKRCANEEPDLPFGCTMCDFRCNKPNKLANHMRVHGSSTIFRCKACKYESSDFNTFKAHRKLHVGITPTDGDNVFSCFVCLMKFTTQDRLQTHMTTHSSTKPFSCHICDFKCVTKSTLLQHLKSHSKQKKTSVFFPCPLCPNKYSTSASLRTHLSNHNTDCKPYQCDFCDYSCYTSELLRVHVQSHSNTNRFRCEICLLSYPSEAKLKAHIRDHLTFDKPLKCNVCGTSFSSRAQLNRHLPIHSGRSDPFVCFICPQSFTSLRSRRNHMRMVHKIDNEDDWKAQQPIVVRPAGQTVKSDPVQEKYGYMEEDIADQSDSDEDDVHLGQHQFIGYPSVKE